MLLNLVFFIIYIGAFLWFVPRWGVVQRAGLPANTLRFLILAKIMMGFAGAYYLGSLPNSDHRGFNNSIAEQFQILIERPLDYFDEIQYQYDRFGPGGLFAASGSFWGYIRYHLVYMFTAPINFISGGNFFLNAAIFSSFTWFGHLFFFRIFNSIYQTNTRATLFATFLIPSLLLFTSCVHKDGLVFVSLAVLSYVFFRWLQSSAIFSWRYMLAGLLALCCIFLLRNYILVAIIPAMLVASFTKKYPGQKPEIAIGSYIIFAVLFFLSSFFAGSLNLPKAVVDRKTDFANLGGGSSDLPLNDLQPNATSFLKNTPQAISHVLLRPFPLEAMRPAVLLAAAELYLYLFIIIWAIWNKRRSLSNIHSFNIYGLAFFLSMVLIIGFTIPNLGAIVRYRSLLWIFLLAPALQKIITDRKKAV